METAAINTKKPLPISFEFFPPKTDKGIDNLQNTAMTLAQLKPHFFSVTYGAGGSTKHGTLDTVLNIKKLTSIETAPHLSCVGLTKEELIQIITEYKQLGLSKLVALRGDLPSGMGQIGDIRYASDLVTLIREQTGDHFTIYAAAYPESHPQSPNIDQDLQNFKKKTDAGVDAAITQYFFNTDAYFDFCERCQKHNIDIPIIPGIMPITNFAKLVRFSNLCGAEIPRWIMKRLEAYHDDIESIKKFGEEVVYKLCQRLIDGGAPSLHFYTLNHADASFVIANLIKQNSN